MTKYEYISEVEKNLGGIPYIEKVKMLDFYREMIEDKIESGMSEEEVIAELGDPVLLAARLRDEYRMNNPEQSASPPPNQMPQKRSSGWKALLVIALIIGSPLILAVIVAVASILFGIAIAIIAVGITFVIGAAGVGITGIVLFLTSFLALSGGFYTFLVQLGLSFLLIALCLLLVGAGVGAIQLLMLLIRAISDAINARKRKAV